MARIPRWTSVWFLFKKLLFTTISLDKAIRDVTGKTSYPVTLWCDNMSAGKCTKMDGAHKLKSFDDSVSDIQRKLKEREIRGNKSHIADTHRDFVKKCVLENSHCKMDRV